MASLYSQHFFNENNTYGKRQTANGKTANGKRQKARNI